MKKDSLISENIGKALLLFVLPLIAGSLIQQLYTTVDAVIVGQFTGKVGLAAIDSVHTLFKFPINFMNGLATGATIMISRYFLQFPVSLSAINPILIWSLLPKTYADARRDIQVKE